MKLKIALALLQLFGCLSNQLSAQTKQEVQNKIRNLNIGDEVPDIYIKNVFNDPKGSASTKEFKDKLLILDFWATTCSGCIYALPKMDSLQKKFGDKIKILPVTYENESLVKEFYTTNKYGKMISLPTVINDTTLRKWFKHYLISHEVWIYKNKVIAITASEYVDEANITTILEGKMPSLPLKFDYVSFDKTSKLIDANKQLFVKDKELAYSAVFQAMPNVPSVKGGFAKDSTNKTLRNYFINSSILSAYSYYWSVVDKSNVAESNSRYILEVKDKTRYAYTGEGYLTDWRLKNNICYESLSPDTGQTKIDQAKAIIADLDRFLGVKGRWEKRNVKCLVLMRITKDDKIKSKGGKTEMNLNEPIKKFRNVPLNNINWIINEQYTNPIVFDETNYNEPVDIDLQITSWTNISAIRKALHAYGLDLKEEIRVLKVFVLTEVGNKK